jgi:uncharacterized protein (TIGR02466 family)
MASAFQKLNQAINLANRGDFDTATALFQEAWYLDKGNQNSFFHYIRCLYLAERDGDVLEALDKYNLDCSAQLDQTILQVCLSSALRSGRLEKQIDILNELYRLMPAEPEICILLSARLMQTQQIDRAVLVIKRALSWNPEDPGLLTNLAILYSETGWYIEAEALYRKVTEIVPRQFLGHYNLAMFLIMMGRHEEARLSLNQSLKIVPSAPEAIAALRQIDERDQPNGELAEFYRCIETHQWELAKQSLLAIKTELNQFRYLAAASELRTQDYATLSLSDYLEASRVVYTTRILQPDEILVGRLITSLRTSPTLVFNRAGKPTVDGLQSHEILADCSDPSFRELNERIFETIDMYIQAQTSNPWLKQLRNNAKHHISGWGVVLRDSGYQKRHVHPEGIISGVIYLQTPAKTSSSITREGNLAFSRWGQYDVVPEVGRIVIFPSYLPHETVPIQGNAERICIAFNIY